MPFLLYLLKTYWWHILRPQTSKRSQVSQQRKCKAWQLYLTFSCSFHRPRGVRVSEKHNHKTENNGLKRTKMTALRQASSLTQTSPLASLSVLWGNVSLPPDQTTAGGSLASLTCPYKASQWTCPSVRTDPRQPLSRKRRECAGRWGGGSTVGLFVTFLYASPAHEVQGCWDLCVYETDCACVCVRVCVCWDSRVLLWESVGRSDWEVVAAQKLDGWKSLWWRLFAPLIHKPVRTPLHTPTPLLPRLCGKWAFPGPFSLLKPLIRLIEERDGTIQWLLDLMKDEKTAEGEKWGKGWRKGEGRDGGMGQEASSSGGGQKSSKPDGWMEERQKSSAARTWSGEV